MEASRRSPNKLRLECALVCVVFFLTMLGEARTFTLARNTGVSVAMLEGHCGRNPSKDVGHAFESCRTRERVNRPCHFLTRCPISSATRGFG
jgi:hypothetical protein